MKVFLPVQPDDPCMASYERAVRQVEGEEKDIIGIRKIISGRIGISRFMLAYINIMDLQQVKTTILKKVPSGFQSDYSIITENRGLST
jgi:hypothetical protein